MTTVNDFVDILRIIREQPEWGDALRSALLSRELLEMPQTLAEFAKATNQRLATLEGDVAELKAGYARLEAGQNRLEGAVGNLRGAAYEQKVANNIATIVRRPLDIRRVRLLKGHGAGDSMTFHDLLDDAEDRGAITGQERTEVGSTDLVIQGERQPGQSMLYVALEISVTAADTDITRAADRSELLRQATGYESVPAIVCAHIDAARHGLAEERNVAVITYGE